MKPERNNRRIVNVSHSFGVEVPVELIQDDPRPRQIAEQQTLEPTYPSWFPRAPHLPADMGAEIYFPQEDIRTAELSKAVEILNPLLPIVPKVNPREGGSWISKLREKYGKRRGLK